MWVCGLTDHERSSRVASGVSGVSFTTYCMCSEFEEPWVVEDGLVVSHREEFGVVG